ncbi:hypothetical protein [Janibacter anophelis]|uniref:hypothetical protein n=1 Tax=Janibacter anophelis TaxID=319054 RepID=UPI000DEF757E|nr:hypothetical protein [Janibacter anophelis]
MASGPKSVPDLSTRDEFDIRARNLRIRMATYGRRLDNVHNHPHNDLTPDDVVMLRGRLDDARAGLLAAEQQVKDDPHAASLALDAAADLADRIGRLGLISAPAPRESIDVVGTPPGSTPVLDAIFWLLEGGPFRRP